MTSDVALLYNSVAMPSVRLWIDPHRVETGLVKSLVLMPLSLLPKVLSRFFMRWKICSYVSLSWIPESGYQRKAGVCFRAFREKLMIFYQGAGLGLPDLQDDCRELGRDRCAI